MTPLTITIIIALPLLALATIIIYLIRDRRTAPYPAWPKFLVWTLVRFYIKIYHRPKILGLTEALAQIKPDEPLIIISNHTGSVDPLIIGTNIRRPISWMMEKSYNKGPAKIVTWTGGTIYLNRDGKDTESLRQAIQILKNNGTIGIFPEGGLARPPETIRPFEKGAAFLIRKSKAVVLPVWLSNTPKVSNTLHALIIPSHSRCQFGSPIRFDNERNLDKITNTLRSTIKKMSNWPYLEETQSDSNPQSQNHPNT